MRSPSRAALAVALTLLVAVALYVRFANVGADLPNAFEGTAAPQLDAFWYLAAAADAHDGVAHEPNAAYDRPLWTLCARAWFAVCGTGVKQAHALGAAFSIVGLLLAAWTSRRALGPSAGFATAALLATATPFVLLGRTPLIYGPVATFLALAALLWTEATMREGRARSVLALASIATLVVTVFAFKGVALVLAPALVASFIASADAPPGASGAPRARRALVAVGVLGVALLVVWGLDVGGIATRNAPRFARYAFHTDGFFGLLRRFFFVGSVPALVTPRSVDVSPRWIGSGALAASPGVFGLALLGVVFAWADRRRLAPSARGALALCATWVAGFVLAATPLDYRPLRFFALIGPPAGCLGGYALARLAGAVALGDETAAPRRSVIDKALAWLAAVFFLTHALGHMRDLLTVALPADARAGQDYAILFVSAVAGVAALRSPLPSFRAYPVAAAALGLLVVVADGIDCGRAIGGIATLVRANEVARSALGERAVLTGPYAELLAIGSPIRRGRFFDVNPASVVEAIAHAGSSAATHVALDPEQDAHGRLTMGLAAAGAAPRLVVVLQTRDTLVSVIRLADAEARGYVPSGFERGRELEDAGKRSEARAAFGVLDGPTQAAHVRTLVRLRRRDDAVAALGERSDDPEVEAFRRALQPKR